MRASIPTQTATPTETPEPTATLIPAPTRMPTSLSFLTLPFYPDTNFQRPSPFGQDSLPDLYNDTYDDSSGTAIAYDGRTNVSCFSGQFPCVKNGHGGIDFGVEGNTPVLAAAPGTVYQRFVINVPGGDPPDVTKVIIGTGIYVQVPVVYRDGRVIWETRELCVQYVHFFPSINVGDRVERGDVIGYVDPRGLGPHLHFEIDGCKNGNFAPNYGSAPIVAIDPYWSSQDVLNRILPLDQIPGSYLQVADSIVIPSNMIPGMPPGGLWRGGSPQFP